MLKFLCSVILAQKDINYLLVMYMSVKNVWLILEKNVPDEISFVSFDAFFCVKKMKESKHRAIKFASSMKNRRN